MKKILFLSLLILSIATSASAFFSDPGPLPDDTGSGSGSGSVSMPVDGGLGFLVLAGVSYGVKKIRKARKGNVEDYRIN